MTTLNSGWAGDINEVYYVLQLAGCNMEEESGKFVVRGGIFLFMGIGPDAVVAPDAEFLVGKTWHNLAMAVNQTSYGLRNVTVIS